MDILQCFTCTATSMKSVDAAYLMVKQTSDCGLQDANQKGNIRNMESEERIEFTGYKS